METLILVCVIALLLFSMILLILSRYKKCPFSKLVGQTLHARTLGFIHPRTNEYIEVNAPLPDYFLNLLEKLD